MKAIQFNQFGPPDVLTIVEVDQPALSKDRMLVKIHAAGVNPIDGKIRDGSSFAAQQLTLPSGLGFDFCGEVITCGSAVADDFQPGDMLLGSVGRHDHPCAYAEYAIVDPAEVIIKPEALDVVQAAALPIVGLTAWQAVHKFGQVSKDDRVLIHAAAGGVGHLAVQIAKLAGAYVIGTASAHHHDFLHQLGLDEIIDYQQASFEQEVNDIDVVIDLVGGETGIRSLNVLQPKGRLITVPTITRDKVVAVATESGYQASGMLAQVDLDELTGLAELVAAEILQLHIAATFPLDQATQAHQLLEQRHTAGKIVLTV